MPFDEHQNSDGGGGHDRYPHRRGAQLGAKTAIDAMKSLSKVRGVCHECAAFTMATTALVIAAGVVASRRGVDIETALDMLMCAVRDKYEGKRSRED